jgi:hypothetical protein
LKAPTFHKSASEPANQAFDMPMRERASSVRREEQPRSRSGSRSASPHPSRSSSPHPGTASPKPPVSQPTIQSSRLKKEASVSSGKTVSTAKAVLTPRHIVPSKSAATTDVKGSIAVEESAKEIAAPSLTKSGSQSSLGRARRSSYDAAFGAPPIIVDHSSAPQMIGLLLLLSSF